MTESEMWLEIAQKCVTSRDTMYLCNKIIVWSDSGAARERLMLFCPRDLWVKVYASGVPWWGYEAEENEHRALACCFLAAMAEEEEV